MGDLNKVVTSEPVEITDGVSLTCNILASPPTGTENGLVVRAIPSGTQTVVVGGSGTVVTFPTGTQPVSGTVTSVPSGTQTVVGGAATGSAVVGNPVLIAGSDGTYARTLLTDTSGNLFETSPPPINLGSVTLNSSSNVNTATFPGNYPTILVSVGAGTYSISALFFVTINGVITEIPKIAQFGSNLTWVNNTSPIVLSNVSYLIPLTNGATKVTVQPAPYTSGSVVIQFYGLSTELDSRLGYPGTVAPAYGTMILGSDGTNARALKTDSLGRMTVVSTCSTSNITTVTSSVSTTTLLNTNSVRVNAIIYNGATTTCYLALGTGATTTNYSIPLAPGGYFEFPNPIYTGSITAVWAGSPTGNVQVTEFSN